MFGSQAEARELILLLIMLIFGAAILMIQLWLCFRGKSKAIRLSPVILLSMATVGSYVMSVTTTDLDSLAYGILVIFVGSMLLMCGVGWMIWGIARLAKKLR